jgi:hypothetical protein
MTTYGHDVSCLKTDPSFLNVFVVIFITTDTVHLHVPVCNFKVLTQKPNMGWNDSMSILVHVSRNAAYLA